MRERESETYFVNASHAILTRFWNDEEKERKCETALSRLEMKNEAFLIW